jgi:hypothetical protein
MQDSMAAWTAAMREARYDDAWALSAQTLAERAPSTRDDPTLPYHRRWVWDGRPVDGQEVLVRCYHGLGDTLQFARFLPLLADRAASVTVEIQPALLGLLAAQMPGIRFVPFDVACPLPPQEVDVGINELDFALRAAPESARSPYLTARPAALPAGTVGLCCSCGDWDAARSIPSALLASLADAAPCISLMPGPCDLPVLNPNGAPAEIAETARIVAGCDLVITVDTMIAHLAGALGRPTWLLLKSEPDWRWDPAQPTSLWYPATTLYLQPSPGDWGAVIDRVAGDLADRVARRNLLTAA